MKNNEHYFTQNPTSEYEKHELSYFIRNKSYEFTSASGVFSKHSVDFGSDLLIKTVSADVSGCSKLLDMGCGYGVIGIVLSDLLGVQATLADINERAIELTKKNAEKYNAKVVKSDGFTNIKDTFNIIVTNPPIRAGKDVYYKWFEESVNYLNDKGCFYCVIQKKQGAPSARNKLIEIYGNCEFIDKDKGYYVLKTIKNLK